MTIEKVTNLYEILIRFDEQTGAFKGAHQQDITLLVEDGVALSGSVGDAKPLDFNDPEIAKLFDEVLQKAVAANDQLKADLENVKAYSDTLSAGLLKASTAIEQANADNAKLAVDNHVLQMQLNAAQAT